MMTRYFRGLSATQIQAYTLFFLSTLILIGTFLFTMQVKVLDNWTLSIPTVDLKAGQEATIVSEYTKLRDVTGVAKRYVECRNEKGAYIRYPLNEAVANRASGNGGTGIIVKIPTDIPNLPAKCRFTVAIVYEVYPWRKVNQSNSTNEFTFNP